MGGDNMFYDDEGNVDEPCLSCKYCICEDIWLSLTCTTNKCPYKEMEGIHNGEQRNTDQ